MDRSEIETRLKRLIVIASNQVVRLDDIRPDVSLVKEGLALDSVAVLQLLVGIEEDFGIALDDGAVTVTTFDSISTLAGLVEGQLSRQKPV